MNTNNTIHKTNCFLVVRKHMRQDLTWLTQLTRYIKINIFCTEVIFFLIDIFIFGLNSYCRNLYTQADWEWEITTFIQYKQDTCTTLIFYCIFALHYVVLYVFSPFMEKLCNNYNSSKIYFFNFKNILFYISSMNVQDYNIVLFFFSQRNHSAYFEVK